MFKAEKSEARVLDEEGEQALAMIDEGLQDATAGRSVHADEIRQLLPMWIATLDNLESR